MTISRTSVALAAVATALLAAGLPAVGQDAPESLLPPGFGDSATPSPTPTRQAVPTPRANSPAAPAEDVGAQTEATPTPSPSPSPTATPTPVSAEEMLKYELPAFAKRSLARVGVEGRDTGGMAADAFGGTNGRFLEALMRRLDAPLPSRWMSIGLRRALISSVDTPARVNGADFAAERAWLLLRMGEAVAARAVVDSVDTANYSPKLFQIAMQASLATADPAGMCPLVGPVSALSANEKSWTLAGAMCTGLAGKPRQAGKMIDAAARNHVAQGVDLRLAEKVVGMGTGGRRGVTIRWDGVDGLNSWRYGLATASGTEIPDDLIDAASPQLRYWRALSPYLSPSERIGAAQSAAAQGVVSSAALVDLYGLIDESEDGARAEVATASDLRSAYTEEAPADRVAMMQQLWSEPDTARLSYARLVLTARAAAAIAPKQSHAEAADRLIASMLSAGFDLRAERWAGTVARGSDGWAMLALADPNGVSALSSGDIDRYRTTGAAGDRHKVQMFFAGLAGLGRIADGDAPGIARDLDVRLGMENSWTRAIDSAAERGEPGTVMLLAGIGMQTDDWRGIPPEALFHIVAAMRATGLEGYGRMIAAEAIARL